MGRTKRKRMRKKGFEFCKALDHETEAINLRQFMARNGFRDDINLKLRNFDKTGRGVATKKTLHENDVIIRVPYNLMVTYTTLELLGYPQLFHPKSRLNIHDLLSVFLIMERHKKGSFWSSYINSLPSKPLWIPSLMSEEYIELLPFDVRLAAKKSRRLLEESWSRLRKSIKSDWTCSCCGERADCVLDWNSFTWGYVLVNTRAVYVNPETIRELSDWSGNILSDEPCMALCPYLDMFNHSYSARTKAELIQHEGMLVYQLTSLTRTKKHEQVFISYGAHDNVRLLTEYGFFIPGNCHDLIPFRSEDIFRILQLNLNDFQYNFIRRHGLDKSSELYISDDGPSFNLKAFLFTACEGDERRNLTSVIYNDSYPCNTQRQFTRICRTLLQFQLETIKESIKMFESLDVDSLIIDFLKYRGEFVKRLCDNKLKYLNVLLST